MSDHHKWPDHSKTLLLQSVLKGKAQAVYSVLDPAQRNDYALAKSTILQAHELVPEAYRHKFPKLPKK